MSRVASELRNPRNWAIIALLVILWISTRNRDAGSETFVVTERDSLAVAAMAARLDAAVVQERTLRDSLSVLSTRTKSRVVERVVVTVRDSAGTVRIETRERIAETDSATTSTERETSIHDSVAEASTTQIAAVSEIKTSQKTSLTTQTHTKPRMELGLDLGGLASTNSRINPAMSIHASYRIAGPVVVTGMLAKTGTPNPTALESYGLAIAVGLRW